MEINKQVSLDWLEMYATAEQLETVVDKLAKGTFDSPSTQEEIERQLRLLDNEVEIKERLREANKLLEAERDEWKKESKLYFKLAIQAEKERDIAVKALQELADADDSSLIESPYAMRNIAENAIEEIRRNTDAPKDTNGLS